MTPAQAAATVAALQPIDSELAQLARLRLDQLVRDERNAMSVSPYFHSDDHDIVKTLGTPLRDAAVNPRPHEVGPAGSPGEPGPAGNPHGTNVWNAEVGSDEYQRQVELARAGEAVR